MLNQLLCHTDIVETLDLNNWGRLDVFATVFLRLIRFQNQERNILKAVYRKLYFKRYMQYSSACFLKLITDWWLTDNW